MNKSCFDFNKKGNDEVRNISLKRLGQLLTSFNYSLIVQTLSGGRLLEPWLIRDEKINSLPYPISSIVKLFFLSESISDPSKFLGKSLFSDLVQLRIIEENCEGLWNLGEKYIVPLNGIFLLSDVWKTGHALKKNQVWFAKDTLFLARILPPLRDKKVLDLGSGTGIHAILSASRGAYATAVDINERAVKYTNINVALNDVGAYTSVHLGNLYDPVKGEKFDYIIANSPFIPILNERSKQFTTDHHDASGLQVFNDIINGLSEHLLPKGTAVILCGGFGDSSKPYIVEEIKRISKMNHWDTTFLMLEKMTSSEKLRQMTQGDIENIDHNPDTSYYYTFLVIIKNELDSSEFTFIPKINRQYIF